MRFSERIGKTNVRTALQVDGMDITLRNQLWNTILKYHETISNASTFGSHVLYFQKHLWENFFKKTLDELPRKRNNYGTDIDTAEIRGIIKIWFMKAEWYNVYDFIEEIALFDDKNFQFGFSEQCNTTLKLELAGYRLIQGRIVQITSEQEILEIEEAINETDKWKNVNTHLFTALEFIADKKTPNYRNSIKESISAVEAICKIITNNEEATLGQALNEIGKNHALHGALKNAFTSMYGYTSDASGIRHSLAENDIAVDFEEAKFMLVVCSAFINFLKSKYTA